MRPTRRFFITVLTLLGILAGAAGGAFAFNAADAFIGIPRQDLDILTISMRQDMTDYMEADSVLKKTNVFLGESWIEQMDSTSMRVHLTDASNLQIQLLPLKKSRNPLVMTIYAVTADNGTSDSTIKFYDTEMKELPASNFFTLPDPKKFYVFPKHEKVNKKEIYDIMPFYTIDYAIKGDTLTGKLTMSDYLTLEQAEKVKRYLNPEIRWVWDGKRFNELKSGN